MAPFSDQEPTKPNSDLTVQELPSITNPENVAIHLDEKPPTNKQNSHFCCRWESSVFMTIL